MIEDKSELRIMRSGNLYIIAEGDKMLQMQHEQDGNQLKILNAQTKLLMWKDTKVQIFHSHMYHRKSSTFSKKWILAI